MRAAKPGESNLNSGGHNTVPPFFVLDSLRLDGLRPSHERSVMRPTIEWRDDKVVMIDQRRLPLEEIYVECRTADDVAEAIETMVIRGAPAIGVAAAFGLALGFSRLTDAETAAGEFDRISQRLHPHPPDGAQPLLGARTDEGRLRRSPSSAPRRTKARPDPRSPGNGPRGCRDQQKNRRERRRARQGRRYDPDSLQRGRLGHGGLWNGGRRHPRGLRAGEKDRGPRRRDPAVPPGRAPHGV